MTIAQVQPLNIFAAFSKAHDFLFEAHMLVTDVKSLFLNSGHFADCRPAQGHSRSPC